MTTLTVIGNTDYRSAPNSNLVIGQNITDLTFSGLAFTQVTFNNTQFGGANISLSLHVTGDAFTNFIIVDLPAAGLFTADNWTFSNWTGSDKLIINGSAGADTITGSDFADTIGAGDGADIIDAGGGNDLIGLIQGHVDAGEQINGGSGTDRFLTADNETISITGLVFDSVEQLFIADGTNVAISGGQIGGTRLSEIITNSTAAVATLNVTGSSSNLSALTFSNWGDEDIININGVGVAANTLVGSREDDVINGGLFLDNLTGGRGTDNMSGGQGNDTFNYNIAVELAFGEIIDGGGGTLDTIRMNTSGGYDFAANLTLSGVERLVFAQTSLGSIASLTGAQLSGFTNVTGSAFTDQVTVFGATANLSALTFTNWTNGTDTIRFIGTSGIDTLTGSSQDDIFNPGQGADVINGGAGDDVFVINGSSMSGKSIDFGTGILDSLQFISGGTYDLSVLANLANVEQLLFTSNANQTVQMTGEQIAEFTTVTGDTSVNALEFTGRLIDLSGLAFSNWTDGVDSINLIGAVISSTLTGSSRNDTITGNVGSDTLNGAAGADTLEGGLGNDTYIVSDALDVIIEGAGDAADRVQASLSFTLGAGMDIEVLQTSNSAATAAINLTGNALSQTITGNGGVNTLNGGVDSVIDVLSGLGGDDTYIINSAIDNIVEVAGFGTADRVRANVSFTLESDDHIEIMSSDNPGLTTAINLTGNAIAQTIYGNAGANILNGGIDALKDTLVGAAGNDTYVINSALDNIIETAGNGTADRAKLTVSFVLGAGDDIEFLETTDAAGLTVINLTGNELAQTINGNAAVNILNGGLGNDTLTGRGAGDFFLFNTALNAATNHDTITDFNVINDIIQLENAIFTLLTTTGTLAANLFEANSIAGQNGSEVVIYDKVNGDIYYDTNGAGAAGGLVLFADVANNTALTAADFVVV